MTQAFLACALVSGVFAVPSAVQPAPPEALTLGPGDLRIEQLSDGGYHLYVRAKPGLGSILLTESTKDPALKTDSFAYRALDKNAINGGEMRILDGKSLPLKSDFHFLVDSSPEPDTSFGKAFHIFIPWVVAWGYSWSRSGKEFIHDGSFINIRAFAKAYADYSGRYADNPYLIRVSQGPSRRTDPAAGVATPTATAASTVVAPTATAAQPAVELAYRPELYYPEMIAAFRDLTVASGGQLRYASSDQDIVRQIGALLDAQKGKSLDFVLCLDTTDTMINGIDVIKAGLPALLSRKLAEYPSMRLGLVAFKDYFEEYLYKHFDFTRDVGTFSDELESLQGGGGRDVPEAVYEALFAAASGYPWEAQSRLVVLVGDAPPHPIPRGSIDASTVDEAVSDSGVIVDAVAVPK